MWKSQLQRKKQNDIIPLCIFLILLTLKHKLPHDANTHNLYSKRIVDKPAVANTAKDERPHVMLATLLPPSTPVLAPLSSFNIPSVSFVLAASVSLGVEEEELLLT
jgi:hypothetical protein